MSSWMRWLLWFLVLRAEGDADPGTTDQGGDDDLPPEDPPDPGDGDPLDDSSDDLSADQSNEQPTRGPGRREQAVIEARRRAQDAERERDQARSQLEAHQRSQTQTAEQRQWQEEENILRNPQSTDEQRYWVNANRTLRATQRDAAQARIDAADARDISAYDASARSYPTMEKYRDRVEQFVETIRRNGGTPPPRQVLFDTLLGRDIREGKFKPSTAKPGRRTTTEDNAPNVNRLPADQRGNPTVRARGDVSRRPANTESERRRARLENQSI